MGARGDLSGSRRIDQGSSATSHGTGSDRSITSACISIDRGTHARVYSGTSSHDVRSTPTLICGSSARSHGACSAHVFGTCCRDRDLRKGSSAHSLRSTSSHYHTDRGNSGFAIRPVRQESRWCYHQSRVRADIARRGGTSKLRRAARSRCWELYGGRRRDVKWHLSAMWQHLHVR